MRADCPRILSHECATLALLDTFSRGVTRKTFETFRRVEIYIAADLRRNPHQTPDTHNYSKFFSAACAL